jgi:arginase family enzyme
VSLLRARCPDCRTLTAVALGDEYQCHSCGREYGAGLVRVPRAWGEGGEAMAAAAALDLPYPEAAVVEEDSLHEQTLVLAAGLPDRPLVLGGCCCAHLGAIEGLSARVDRLAVVWLDAHGDLNTPETSPSGNPWGMPLRMAIDSGAVAPGDVALVGARVLDPAEQEFVAAAGVHTGGARAVEAATGEPGCVYVALDCDVFAPGELEMFMPEPGGPTVAEVARLLEGLAARTPIIGAGLTGLRPAPANVEPLRRLVDALGF